MQHRTCRDRRRQRDRAGHPRPVPVGARVGAGGQLQPQQCPARIALVPLDGGPLPVARRQQQHPSSARRGLQLEHVDRQPPVPPYEGSGLPGTGLDDARRQRGAAGYGVAHRVPLTSVALRRIGRPRRENAHGQISAPLHRPQNAPGLFLSHTHDAVIDPDTLRGTAAPAQTPQRHPRVRRQSAAPGVLTRRQHVHIRGVPVLAGQRTGRTPDPRTSRRAPQVQRPTAPHPSAPPHPHATGHGHRRCGPSPPHRAAASGPSSPPLRPRCCHPINDTPAKESRIRCAHLRTTLPLVGQASLDAADSQLVPALYKWSPKNPMTSNPLLSVSSR